MDLPILAALRHQATKALASLQREIARQEKELEGLKAEAERWARVLGGRFPAGRAPAASLRARTPQRFRVDWNAVLMALPATFTAKEVAQKAGKPLAQVYTHVSPWMKAKKVRKGKDGYQKVAPARRPRQQ